MIDAIENRSARPPVPYALEPRLSNIPSELRDRPQWVLWRHTWRRDDRKYAKVPYQPSGATAKTTDVNTWNSFTIVASTLKASSGTDGAFSGVGFVFSDDDPYVGVDIDDCRDPQTGAISPFASEIIATLCGAYGEISPSGTGVHLIARGRLPYKGKKDDSIGLEMYQTGRYFCITGHLLDSAQ